MWTQHHPLALAFWLILLFLVGCNPVASTTSTTATIKPFLVPTIEITSIDTPTTTSYSTARSSSTSIKSTVTPFIPTETIKPKSGHYPLETATITPTGAVPFLITNTPYYGKQPLSKLMLTIDDILSSSNAGYLVHSEFIKGNGTTVTDASEEVASECLLECTKQVWATTSQVVTGYGGNLLISNRRAVILMMHSTSEEGAKKTADNLFEQFSSFADEYGIDELKKVNAPIENTHIGFIDRYKFSMVITTSKGSIAIMVVSYPEPLSDDGGYELEIAADFMNIQLDKLEKFGAFQ